MNLTPIFFNEKQRIIYKIVAIIYDLNKRDIKSEKLLKELSLIARPLIEKLLKEFIKILFISIVPTSKTFSKKSLKESKKALNINELILQIKEFYKNNEFAQRIIHIKTTNKRKTPQNLIK